MNSKQLRYFLTTADKGSITAAAKSLEIAQPAISLQISSLEHELSVQLFERDFRGVRLTQSGEKFYLRAKSIVHQMDIAKTEVIHSESNPSGRIAIGMAQSVCNVLSIPLIELIQKEYPNVELTLYYGHTELLSQWLHTGEIDLSITYENSVTNRNFCVTPIIKEDIFLVVGSQSDNAKYQVLHHKEHIDFKELAKYEIIKPNAQDPLVQILNRYETQTRVSIWSKQNFGLLMTNLRYVTEGKGLMFLPSSATFHLEKAEKIKNITVKNPALVREVMLVSNSSRPSSVASQVVSEAVLSLSKQAHSLGHWRGELLI